jgi:hypothetical protein
MFNAYTSQLEMKKRECILLLTWVAKTAPAFSLASS